MFEDVPTQFGIFYPTGYIVVTIPKEEDARKVLQDLMTGGYDESECWITPGEKFAARAQSHLDNAGFVAKIGMSDEILKQQIEAASRGCVFLLIYSPSDIDSDRVMRVVRRVPFESAHRYHTLAIQVLE